jgi:WD40 repeat protein
VVPSQIWDLKTYKIKTDLPGHTDEVYCVDFVADKIVSGGRDRLVKMYAFVINVLVSITILIKLFACVLDGKISPASAETYVRDRVHAVL